MPNILYPNAILAGDPVLASAVSDNLTAILAVVNSGGLDSVNYKVSGVESQNIKTGAIVSQHVSNSQIVAAHISNSQIVHAKMQFLSASSGVRVLQIAASDSMKASGLELVRVSGSIAIAAATATANAYWSAGIDGADRSWTATPFLIGQPAVYATATGIGYGPRDIYAQTLNSDRALLSFQFSAAVTGTFTWYVGAIGEPTI